MSPEIFIASKTFSLSKGLPVIPSNEHSTRSDTKVLSSPMLALMLVI